MCARRLAGDRCLRIGQRLRRGAGTETRKTQDDLNKVDKHFTRDVDRAAREALPVCSILSRCLGMSVEWWFF